ncbi:MAG: hypothetical protein F4Z34_13935 [Acidimicrobiaceae bacterium]|nr:hypothetical protein [Acidimicrobiaceae bacterium]
MRLQRSILTKPLLHVAGPSAVIMAPLLGLTFHSDQRIMMYWLTGAFGADPFAIVNQNLAEIGDFVRQGNFRPLGRFVIYMEQTSIFEVAAGTGIAPHVIQGVVRLIMVSALAVAAMCFVVALYDSARSASIPGAATVRRRLLDPSAPLPPVLAAFPLVVASTFVVSGALHPASFFPFFFVAVAIYLLLVPLYVCSGEAMTRRGIGIRSAALCAVLGMVSAMTSELLYLVPVVCLLTIATRWWLSRQPGRELIRSSAFSRLVALSVGFLVVFVPSRLAIAAECSRGECYEGSSAVLSTLAVEQWLGRAVAGLQFETLSSTLAGDYDNLSPARDPIDFVTNVWLILVVLSLGCLAVTAAIRVSRASESADRLGAGDLRRLGAALCGFGGLLALVTTLMVSLSEGLQGWHDRGFGLDQWRDSLLVQIAWALILYGLAVIALSYIGRGNEGRRARRAWLAAGVTALVFVMSMNAFMANDKFSIWRRTGSDSTAVNLIATASVDFDRSERGQAIRCELISAYTERNCTDCWHSGQRVLEELNRLSRSRHNADFCPVGLLSR